jgi:hypothetical protein
MNKITHLLLVLILALPIGLFAQITHGGTPFALNNKLSQPQQYRVDNSELAFIDSSYTKDCSALEFARFLELHSSFADDMWTVNEIENGDRLYRLAIKSEGALSIGLYMKDFYIPKGGKLFVYDPNLEEVYGSYTYENNTESGFFSPEIISGDELILEYYEPKQVFGQTRMELVEVLHAYRSVFNSPSKDFGDSGDCEINAKCPEGYGKGEQRDAVLRLLIKNGTSGIWCTGSLINNVRQDKTPYVLTADHCGKHSSDEDMLQWRFYFHYQSNNCDTPENEPTLKSMVGCEMMAASNNTGSLGSDFFLIKLVQNIPSTYNPFFIGWNRDGVGSDNGYCFHHPQGDIKKISTYLEPLSSAHYSGGIPNAYWEVHWSQTQSGQGVTEGGSSGSPIFDEEGLLIGTLTGGQASCSNQNAPDYYGKFSVHWTDNGNNSDEQLAPWLDPDNTGQLKLAGVFLDVNELKKSSEKGFSLLPNPANNNVEIRLENQLKNVEIELYHINGQLIHTYYFSNSSIINISNLPTGVYVVKMISDDNFYSQKLIKK